jgi:O-antigen/teichoic acid export membrane protein
MAQKNSILKNTSYLGLSTIASYLLLFSSTVAIARFMGPENFGKVNVAQIVGICICILTDGMKMYGVRAIARGGNDASASIAEHFRLIVRVAVVTLVIASLVIALLPIDNDYRILLFTMVCSSMVMAALYVDWIFQGREMMGVIAIANFMRYLVYVVLVLCFLAVDRNVRWVGVATLLATLAASTYLLFNVSRTGIPLASLMRPTKPSVPGKLDVRRFGEQFTLGLTSLRNQVFFAPATMLLGILGHHAEAGYYNAGFKLAFFLGSMGNVYMQSFFPRVCSYCAGDSQRLNRFINRSTRLLVYVALPVGVGITLLADKIVILVFGAGYASAGNTFRILTWAVLVMLVSYNFSSAMIGYGRQNIFLKAIMCVLACNVAATLFFMDHLGDVVAWISLLSEIAVLSALAMICVRGFGIRVKPDIVLPFCGSLAMGGVIWWINLDNLLVNVVIGVIVYLLFLTLSRGSLRDLIRLDD